MVKRGSLLLCGVMACTGAIPEPEPGVPPLILVAGQSNAEGNAPLGAIADLARAIPGSGDVDLVAARAAVAAGRGTWCDAPIDPRCFEDPAFCEGDIAFTHATADAAITALGASDLPWRDVTAGWAHDTVRFSSEQYGWSPMAILDADGTVVDNEACVASPSDTTAVGPELSESYALPGVSALTGDRGGPADEIGPLFGPELGLGLALGPSHPDTVLYKVAMGGASLAEQWRPGGPLYAQLVDAARTVPAQTGTRLAALVWFQGFNDQFEDVYCRELAPRYEANLTAFVTQLRDDVGTELPVVIVKARSEGLLPVIQDAQDAVAAALPAVTTVESADLSDCFHYGTASQLVIGERSAAAVAAFLESD